MNQGNSETLQIVVDKNTNTADFKVICPAEAKELFISYDKSATWTKLQDLDCSNGEDSVQYTVPAPITTDVVLDFPKIPFLLKAKGAELETRAIPGNFLKPDFTSPSITTEGGAAATKKLSVEVSLSANLTASDISLTPTEVYITNVAGCGGGSSWVPFAPTIQGITLTAPNNPNYLYAKFRDVAGNESTCASSTIYQDGTAPVAQSVAINGGAAQATSLSVTLSHVASGDVTEMKVSMNADCSGSVAWVPYATSSSRTLAGPGLNYYSVLFRDAVGNESACLADGIVYDTDPPATPSTLARGAGVGSVDNENPIYISVSPYVEGDTIRIFSDSTCSTEIGNGTSLASGLVGSVAVSLPSDGNYQFWGRVDDFQGSFSNCSTVSTTYQLDTEGPASPTITSPLANGDYQSGTTIPIQVQFSEPVLVSGTPFINLALYGATVGVHYSSGSGTNTLVFNYVVDSNHASQDLDLAAVSPIDFTMGSITDLFGNPFSLSVPTGASPGSLASNKAITIQFAVSVSSVVRPLAGTFLSPRPLDFIVRWSGPVVITGTPRLVITVGGVTHYASYSGMAVKSGPRETVFQLNAWTADDYDGIVLQSIDSNGGTIRNQFAVNVNLAMAAIPMPEIRLINGADPVPSMDGSTFIEFSESDGAVSIPLTLSAAPEVDLEVKYAVLGNDRSTNSLDHNLGSGSVTIPAGQTTGSINFVINDDIEIEGYEGFTIALISTSYGTLPSGSGQSKEIYISDNDTLPSFMTITKISTSPGHTCFATSAGSLYCFGGNGTGQLGDGTTISRTSPVLVFSSGVSDVTTGANHTCAVVSGALYCWGYNAYGQLGLGDAINRSLPVLVTGMSMPVSVQASSLHTCSLNTAGTLYCWGYGASYRLGNNSTLTQTTPAQLALANISQFSISDAHGCALSVGQLYCWGINNSGQLGTGNTTTTNVPTLINNPTGLAITAVATASNKTCGIFDNAGVGTALCWGANNFLGRVVGGNVLSIPAVGAATLTHVSSFIDAGRNDQYTAARMTNGSIGFWSSTFVQYSGATTSDAVAVNSGTWTYADSLSQYLQSTNVNYRMVTGSSVNSPFAYSSLPLEKLADYNGRCLLTTAGEIYCANIGSFIGDGSSIARTIPTRVGSNFIDVANASVVGCGLRNDFTLWCWGANISTTGSVGDGSTINRLSPVYIGSDYVSVKGGYEHFCGHKSNGDLMCWGSTQYGQVGSGTVSASSSAFERRPLKVLSNVTSYDLGHSHSCAISSGSLFCWGRNNSGQLGDLTGSDTGTPSAVFFINAPTSLQSVTSGDYHNCAIKNGNEVTCWGLNSSGQLGRGNFSNVPFPFDTILTNTTSIVANTNSTCSIDQAGQLRCWGANPGNGSSATINSPPASPILTGVTSISPGLVSQAKTASQTFIWGNRTGIIAPLSPADVPLYGFPRGQ